MTVVERGNNDIVVLSLVTVALCWCSSRPSLQRAAVALCGVAGAIKLYPVVTLLPWWSRKRTRFWVLGISCLLIVYFALTIADLKLVAADTPEPLYFAFGARTLGLELAARHLISSSALVIITAGVIVALVCSGVVLGLRLPPATIEAPSVERLAFLTGSLLYLAVFLANSNWAYRLVMLSFTIPYLATALSSDTTIVRRLASLTLFAACGLSWGLRVNAAIPLTAVLAAVLFVLLLAQCVSESRTSLTRVPLGSTRLLPPSPPVRT
jgi:hypothetical protein